MGNKGFHNDHIKDQLSNWETTPSDKVWEGIQQELEIDRKAITAGNRNRLLWGAAGATALVTIALLLFRPATGMQAYQQVGNVNPYQPDQKAYITHNQSVTTLSESTNLDKTSIYTQALAGNNPLPFTTANLPSSANTTTNSVSDNEGKLEALSISDTPMAQQNSSVEAENHFLAESAIDEHDANSENGSRTITPDFVANTATAEKNDNTTETGNIQDPSEYAPDLDGITELLPEDRSSLKGFYAGGTAGYNATTILSNRALLSNYTTSTTSFLLLPTKGIALGYFFNDRFSVQAEYIHNVAEGAAIHTTEGNIDRQLNLSMYFDQFPVMFKFRNPTYHASIARQGSFNVIAGLQYNKLRAYRIPQERRYEISPTDVIFEPTSWSFLAGTEYEMFVFPNWMISLGLEATVSQDLSTFDNPLSNYPKHSFATGIRGGIYYYLGRD